MYNLKRIIKEAKLTQSDISKFLNIKSLSTVNLKINGKADFTTKEALSLKKLINDRSNKNYLLEDLFSNQSESNSMEEKIEVNRGE